MFVHGPSPLGFLFGILGFLSVLAILAGIVLLVLWAIRAMPRTAVAGSASRTTAESPEDILARRFAMGEIGAEEFTRSRDLLRGTHSAGPPTPPG